MKEEEQFTLVLKRIQMIAQIDHSNELEDNVLSIFNKLSKTEKIVLLRGVLRSYFKTTKELTLVNTEIEDNKPDEERVALFEENDKDLKVFKIFVAKVVVAVSVVLLGITIVVGGFESSSFIDNFKELAEIIFGQDAP